MQRMKIFGKFIVWLLKKIFRVPLLALAHIHLFLDFWKQQCRKDWGLATLFFILTTASCTVSSLFGVLLFIPEAEVNRHMLGGAVIRGFYVSAGIFVFVMLLAAYDAFKEEYEQSFTKLKE